MKILDNLKFSQKMTLSVLSFLLPIGVLLYYVTDRYNYEIQWSVLESYGNRYQRPLESLLKMIPEHEFMATRFLHSQNIDIKDAMGGRQVEIDKAFDRLVQADQQVGVALQFTDEGLGKRKRLHFKVASVRAEWESLKSGWSNMSLPTLAEKHAHLVNDIKTMITHSGDTSNLILDPDLDSYYVMDMTLLALPQTQDRLIAITSQGWDMLKKKGARALSREERALFAVWAAQLKESDLARVEGDVATVLNEDQNFYGILDMAQSKLPPAFSEYKSKTTQFIRMLEKLSSQQDTGLTAQEYASAASSAREASFTFWDYAVDIHDAFMRKRVEHFQSKRNQALLVTSVSLIISLLIAFLITRSITGPFNRIYEILNAQASLNFSQKLSIDSTDEFGAMGKQVNAVSDGLRSTIQEIMNSSSSLGEAAMGWATVISEDMSKKGASSAMKEMEGSVTEVAASSSELSELAGKFRI